MRFTEINNIMNRVCQSSVDFTRVVKPKIEVVVVAQALPSVGLYINLISYFRQDNLIGGRMYLTRIFILGLIL